MRNRFETDEFGRPPDLPALANATIRSPATSRRAFRGRPQTGLNHAPKALVYLTFCSLRLSVRTPPFHGGESGSIPLGSATLARRAKNPQNCPRVMPASQGCRLDGSRPVAGPS